MVRNVYADFAGSRKRHAELFYEGDAEELFSSFPAVEDADDSSELLKAVFARIAFLTRAYREVVILFYLDGKSTEQIATLMGASETAVRQRLFSARKKLRNEVAGMDQKPVVLDKIDICIWGNGDPDAGDPRKVCIRQFSNHIVWLCRKKPMSAAQIAEELHVPTVYVEEELEILTRGEDGRYGLLRRMGNGMYAINFVLFDREAMEEGTAIYQEHMPKICSVIADFFKVHREEYLAYPYLKKKVDLNLVLWQQIQGVKMLIYGAVQDKLSEKYFGHVARSNRPFTVYGYDAREGYYQGNGFNRVYGKNVCGYSKVYCGDMSNRWIRCRFDCGLNMAQNLQIQLALRAIEGIDISTLSEEEKEHAAKAVECDYLYRDEERLYTKILVSRGQEDDRGFGDRNIFSLTSQLSEGYFDKDIEEIAEKIADLIHKNVPEYLFGDYEHVINLAGLRMPDLLLGSLVEQGVLVPPKDGVGAEGCWIFV